MTRMAVTGPGRPEPIAAQVELAKWYFATFTVVPSLRTMMPAATRISVPSYPAHINDELNLALQCSYLGVINGCDVTTDSTTESAPLLMIHVP